MAYLLVRYPALTAVMFAAAALALVAGRRSRYVTLLTVWDPAPFLLTLLTVP
ncbi:hypothetical protein OHB56_03010 [Streptomyces sp. NBC_01635]|uniref:hypothetical protein n=1 Tax=Streptomyces sp. NBC_01635 TaxID=2975904 RepID=UPI0038678E39|nr:hypothetical protein OHB56_03010 [Streptomyces sp. NBC_01635]